MKAKLTGLVSNELLNQALNASSCSICIADMTKKDMPLIYVNKTFEKITGYEPKEVIGKNCRFLQGSDQDQPALKKIRKALKGGVDCTVQIRNYRKDGTMFWNELHLSPIFNDKKKLVYFVGVQTDVTARVEAEEENEKYRTQLENLVQERTKKLEDKNTALQEILSQIELEKKKVKDQVVENVDTVLMPLLHKIKARLSEKDTKYVELIQKNLEELTSTFGSALVRKLYSLSPKEIEICSMIRSGLSTKDIAQFFHVSTSTIENQRNSIRKKLGISQQSVNLTSYLQSLAE